MAKSKQIRNSIDRDLELELKRLIFTDSYFEFFKWSFFLLFPNEKFEDTFHIRYLCDLYQVEIERVIRKEERTTDLIVNIPPRTSKSLITSVSLLAWMWIKQPSLPMISISFDEDLSLLNAQYSKDIIKSDEYQELFGHLFQIRGDADSKSYFMNDKGGFRLSKTTGSNITGHKGTVCFPKGQMISTSTGELDIADVVERQLQVPILSFNEKSRVGEFKPIVHYLKSNYIGRLYTIQTTTRRLICTSEHPIYVVDKGWVEASKVPKNGSVLLKRGSETESQKIRSISFKEVENLEVYNLEVKDNNNYYIDGVLVHNCIVDDPQNPKTSESELSRKVVIEYYTRALYNRLTPINLGIRIIIMQRLHENDLTGFLLATNPEQYRHICLPAEVSDIVKPIELKEKYTNGLLDPTRLSAMILSGFRKTLGLRGYTGQYEQRPSPDEGGIIKRTWFDILLPEMILRKTEQSPIHFFIDSAYTAKTENDPTGILTCFVQDNFLYVLDFTEKWLEFPELCKNIIIHTNGYQYTHLSKIFIEPKASGKSIVQQLRSVTSLNVIEAENPEKDKVTRAHSIAPTLESRRVRLIQGQYVEHFLDLLGSFPSGNHDEAIDTLVMAVRELLIDNNPDFMFI